MLTDVPWDALRRTHRRLRKLFFSKDRKDLPYIKVDATAEEVERELGKHSFAPNWEFSYYYRGEDVNLARVIYEATDAHPDIVWWQVHVRGFVTEGGIELQAHWEPEPTEHDVDHIEGVGYDNERGIDMLSKYVEETDLTVVEDAR